MKDICGRDMDVLYKYIKISNAAYKASTLTTDLFINISLSCLYYRGLNSVANAWYLHDQDEYEKYGETEKIHELLILITRVAVVVMISIIAAVIYDMAAFIYWYYSSESYEVVTIGAVIGYFIQFAFYNLRTLSIHFIYEFGHIDYKRMICNSCDAKMYQNAQTAMKTSYLEDQCAIIFGLALWPQEPHEVILFKNSWIS